MRNIEYKIDQGTCWVLNKDAKEWAKMHGLRIEKINCATCEEIRITNKPFFFKDRGEKVVGLSSDPCKCGSCSSTMISANLFDFELEE